MIINVTHDEGVTSSPKSHAVFFINVGFKNVRDAFYRMAA